MFKRRKTPLPEHVSVALVEQILPEATAHSAGPVPMSGGRATVDRAVWLCACMTDSEVIAPTWLIYDTDDGRLGWCRAPDGVDISGLVSAPVVSGDHVTPEEVLDWLQHGSRSWPNLEPADASVIQDLGRTIRELAAG